MLERNREVFFQLKAAYAAIGRIAHFEQCAALCKVRFLRRAVIRASRDGELEFGPTELP